MDIETGHVDVSAGKQILEVSGKLNRLRGCDKYVVGYLLNKNNFPAAPMLLSFVLAPLLEDNMRKAFILSGGSLGIFFTRPITCVLMIVFLGIILASVLRPMLAKRKAAK